MNTDTSKVLLFTIGAIALLFIGAIGMWAVMKISALPSAPTAAPIVATAPAANPTTQTPTVPATPAASTVPTAPPGYVMVPVINVQPHYITKLIPYQRCHDVAQTFLQPPAPPTGVGAVIGGVAGGLAGNAMGAGNGRIATTIGGTVLGALAGNAIESGIAEPQPVTVFSPLCRTHYASHSVQSGYRVTYSYNGQQNSIVMPTAPIIGSTIPLATSAIGN